MVAALASGFFTSGRGSDPRTLHTFKFTIQMFAVMGVCACVWCFWAHDTGESPPGASDRCLFICIYSEPSSMCFYNNLLHLNRFPRSVVIEKQTAI